MSLSSRKAPRPLLTIALATALLWSLPALQWVLIPLIYLNTHIHEVFHALSAWLTGGKPLYIWVEVTGTGQTPVLGGDPIVVASAGYLGTSALGSFFIAFGKKDKGARRLLLFLTGLLVWELLFLLKGDVIGFASGIFWSVALGTSLFLSPKVVSWWSQFLGLQMCLSSLQSFLTLYQVGIFARGTSDATLLSQATGIPALFWATAWLLVSLLLMGGALRHAWASPS